MFWLSYFDRWLPNFSHYKMIIVFIALNILRKTKISFWYEAVHGYRNNVAYDQII